MQPLSWPRSSPVGSLAERMLTYRRRARKALISEVLSSTTTSSSGLTPLPRSRVVVPVSPTSPITRSAPITSGTSWVQRRVRVTDGGGRNGITSYSASTKQAPEAAVDTGGASWSPLSGKRSTWPAMGCDESSWPRSAPSGWPEVWTLT